MLSAQSGFWNSGVLFANIFTSWRAAKPEPMITMPLPFARYQFKDVFAEGAFRAGSYPDFTHGVRAQRPALARCRIVTTGGRCTASVGRGQPSWWQRFLRYRIHRVGSGANAHDGCDRVHGITSEPWVWPFARLATFETASCRRGRAIHRRSSREPKTLARFNGSVTSHPSTSPAIFGIITLFIISADQHACMEDIDGISFYAGRR